MPTIPASQEHCCMKPVQANSSQNYWKKPITKKAAGVAQGVGPEFKPQYYKKKKKKKKIRCKHLVDFFLYKSYEI
jgi:hypothetical protein